MSTQLASPVTGLRRPWPARRPALVATVLGVLATLISLAGSWIPSLWGDEAASVLSAERPLATLWTMVQRVDAVHATYYLGLHFWIEAFGASPFSVRFPSAIAVGATVAAVVLIGFQLESAALGWTAGLVVAVLPRMTYVGAEARSYAFSAAIAAWLTLVFLVARTRPERRRLWVGYGVLLCLGIYVFLYVALIATAHAVAILLGSRRRVGLKPWAIATAAALTGALPLIAFGLGERGQIGFLAHRTEVTPTRVFVTLWFGQPIFAAIGWLLVIVGFTVVASRWWRSRGSEQPSGLVVIGSWFLVPTVALIGTSPLVAAFTARYLTICTPAVGLLIAVGILALGRRWKPAVAVAGAAVVVAAVPVWVAQRGPYAENHSDWAEISTEVGQLARPGDAVAFDDGVRPSRRPRLAARMYPAGFAGLDDVTMKHPYWTTTTWHDTAYTIDEAADRGRFTGVSRVWLVEYAAASTVDDYGVSDLRALGYVEGREVATFRSRIIEFTRTGA